MANYTVNASQLQENKVVLVKGKLVYSRLSRLVEGDALARSDAQRIKGGMQAIGKPHTTVTIAHAEIIPQVAGQLSTEEQFVSERRYNSKAHPDQGLTYSIDNKSTRLPIAAKLNEANQAEQVQLTGELASDVEVILVLRVYKPQNYNNRGLSLDQVIIQDTEVKYYSGGATNDALAAAGITYAAPPVAVQATATGAPNTGETSGNDQASAWPTPNMGEPQAAPAAAPVAQTPAPTAPAPTAPVAAEQVSTDPYRSAPAQPAQSDAQAQIAALEKQLAEAKAAGAAPQAAQSDSPFSPAGPITFTGEQG